MNRLLILAAALLVAMPAMASPEPSSRMEQYAERHHLHHALILGTWRCFVVISPGGKVAPHHCGTSAAARAFWRAVKAVHPEFFNQKVTR